MNKGRLFIVSGPSGSGKDTILAEVLKARPEIGVSVSCVTRAMRDGERDGVDYSFISKECFLAMLDRGELLEYNEFVGNYYGTPRIPVEEALRHGRDFILKIDVNGGENVKRQIPEAIRIFIMPPSMQVLKQRLSRRGTESEELCRQRLAVARAEIEKAKEYDYIVVNNDLPAAVADFLQIIDSDRLKVDRNTDFINEVIENAE